MFQKKISRDDFDTIVERLKHETIRQVSKSLGVSPRTLQRYVKSISVGEYTPRFYNPNPRKELDIREIYRLRKEKMSFRRIAKRYNVCGATIYNALMREHQDNTVASDLLYDYFNIPGAEQNAKT